MANEKPNKLVQTAMSKTFTSQETSIARKELLAINEKLRAYEDVFNKQIKLAELNNKKDEESRKLGIELNKQIEETTALFKIQGIVTEEQIANLRQEYANKAQKINIITMPLQAWRSTMLRQVLKIEENKTRLLFRSLGKTFERSAQLRTGFYQIFSPLQNIFGHIFSDFSPFIDGLTNTLKGFGNVFAGGYRFVKGFFNIDEKWDKGMQKMEELHEHFVSTGAKLLKNELNWNDRLSKIREEGIKNNLSNERGFFRNRSKLERYIQKESLKAMDEQKRIYDSAIKGAKNVEQDKNAELINNTEAIKENTKVHAHSNVETQFGYNGQMGFYGNVPKQFDNDGMNALGNSLKESITNGVSNIINSSENIFKKEMSEEKKKSARAMKTKETSWWDKLLSWFPLLLAALSSFKNKIISSVTSVAGGLLKTVGTSLITGAIGSKIFNKKGVEQNTGTIMGQTSLDFGNKPADIKGGKLGRFGDWLKNSPKFGAKMARGGLAGAAIGIATAMITGEPMAGAIGGGIGAVAGGAVGALLGPVGSLVGSMIGQQLGQVVGNKAGDIIDEAMDPGREKLIEKIGQIESKNRDNAQSDSSSAGGRYQFIDETWKKYAQMAGVSEDLSGKIDKNLAKKVMQVALKDYETQLKSAGCPVNETTLYMCHFLGIDGAINVIKSGQDDISNILSQNAFAANPGLSTSRTDIISDIENKLIRAKKEINEKQQLAHGGLITKTGDFGLHEGELVIPKEKVEEWKTLFKGETKKPSSAGKAISETSKDIDKLNNSNRTIISEQEKKPEAIVTVNNGSSTQNNTQSGNVNRGPEPVYGLSAQVNYLVFTNTMA